MIELSLPAGSLEIAITAFENGADSVYFGMKAFSARKGAANFSIEDLAIIKKYAQDNNKKIFIAINTILDEDNIEEVNQLLKYINFYSPDALIIQDLGLAYIIRKYYPSLVMHASTQLAVHTIHGVKALKALGFSRAVLSRELSINEIKAIREACPDIELKAFIHGAMCYGFSGLCMASYIKCGRSANKGECAQLCRSWYTDLDDKKNGYYFSMKDMHAGDYIKQLNDINVDSAKIEGRLKSAEYVAALARYYKGLLANEHPTQDNIKTTFARPLTKAYFTFESDKPSLINTNYPSHIGLRCGKIIKRVNNYITVEKDGIIRTRDVLQCLVKDSNKLEKCEKFPAKIISETHNTYTLLYTGYENLVNLDLYKISSSNQNEKKANTSLPKAKKLVDITLTLKDGSLCAEVDSFKYEENIEIQESITSNFKTQAVSMFSKSDKSLYGLKELEFINNSSIMSPFIPLSRLKAFKKEFYALLDEFDIYVATINNEFEKRNSITLPSRTFFSHDLVWSEDKTEYKGYSVFSFSPISFNEEKMFASMYNRVKDEKNVLIGLNNIGQIEFAKQHPEFKYFIDIYLPVSNRYALELLLEELGDTLIGGYKYIEMKHTAPLQLELSDANFIPPSFISRVCYRREKNINNCKSCKKHYDYHIKDNDDNYVIKVRDCISVTQRV